jgi:glycosyltransferase 2 family protein
LVFSGSQNIRVSYLTSLYFVGAFFNNFLPTSIGGDGYKVYKLGKKIGSTTHAFSATFMERFTGVIALTVISLVSLINVLGPLGVLIFVSFWVIVAAGVLTLKSLSEREYSNVRIKKVFSKVGEVFSSTSEYKNHRKAVFYAFLTSFIVQIISVATQYFVFKGMGIDLPIFYSLFAFPFIFLAGYAIPSINGIGVQDALYIQMFGAVGVSTELALSASILYHLFRIGSSLIGGLLYAAGKTD